MVVRHYNSLPRTRRARSQRGYMLLILMFFVALLTFSMMATLPRAVQQMKRDREEEMIHRGVGYARAIKRYYKKFNRYPGKIEDLENTNNIRFLRRRYKDPISKDGTWKYLSVADVQQGISNPNFGVSQANNFLGGTPPATSSLNTVNQNSSGTTPDASQGNPQANPGDSTSGTTGTSTGTGTQTQTGSPGSPGTGLTGQTFGGGGIVGVASQSKDKTIRVFGGKSNYNKWMFIYDPTQDRGFPIKGPYDPNAFVGQGAGQPIGQPSTSPQTQGSPGMSGAPQGNPGNQMPPDQNAPPE